MEPKKRASRNIDGIRYVKKIHTPRPSTPMVHQPELDIAVPLSTYTQEKTSIKKREKPISLIDNTLSKETYSQHTPQSKPKPYSQRNRLLIFGLFFIAGLFILFSLLDHTVIEVIPKIETQEITKTVRAQMYPKEKELGFDIISVSVDEEMLLIPETDTPVLEYASGMIRVFNNYSTEPQRLIEGTRFETLTGKIFIIPVGTSVTIPGKVGDTPGSIDVMVQAIEPGADYNIDLSDFSLPGFQGTPQKYTQIYGLSLAPMTGGFMGTKKTLSEEQIQIAKVSLEAKLQETLENRIRAEKTQQFFLIKNTGHIQKEEVQIQEEGDRIRLIQKARGSSLIVSKHDLDRFIVDTFFPIEHTQTIKIRDYHNLVLSMYEIPPSLFDISEINLQIEASLEYTHIIDTESLLANLKGQRKETILSTLTHMGTLSYAHVNIFPFWRKKTSDTPEKFKFHTLNY